MHIELDPPHGITGFRIGMPVEQLVPAAVAAGRVVIDDPDLAGVLDHMKVDLVTYLEHSSFATVFGLEDAQALTWLELHAPRPTHGQGGKPAGVGRELHVTWRGIDVFTTPALDLLKQIDEHGYAIDRSHAPLRYTIPALEMRFNREARHDAPTTRDGQARFMQSVFVAGPGYLEQPLPEIDFDALTPKPLRHRFRIDPLHGVAGFPFGMPVPELIAAATPLGHVRLDDPGQARPDFYTKLHLTRASFAAIFACEDGQSLTAVELWAPSDAGGDEITVEIDGIDVFAVPAAEIISTLVSRGHALDDTDPDHPRFPGLAVGFTRTSGHEVPLADDGRPRHFQAVLTGPAGYYDRPLPPTEIEGGEPWKSRLTRPRTVRDGSN